MLTTIGVWLLVVSAVAIVVEGVLAAIWAASLVKRSRALSEGIERQRALIEADLERLRAAVEETRRLWRPYERILRLVRHPLAIALLQSLAGRWAGAR
ncbi:MAG: hypothetical protein ACREOY_03870 [Candidatus Dormibacteraceae bacterium]